MSARRSGIILGMGLGGFIDGILLHQIAHWHSMGSAILPPISMEALKQNMRWDGWVFFAIWTVTLVGIYLLLADARQGRPLPRPAAFTGLMLTGWGLFNLVEGIIDHHLLGLHHVRDLPAHVPLYDWLFLLVGGVGFIVAGRRLAGRASAGAAAGSFDHPVTDPREAGAR